MSIAGSYKK